MYYRARKPRINHSSRWQAGRSHHGNRPDGVEMDAIHHANQTTGITRDESAMEHQRRQERREQVREEMEALDAPKKLDASARQVHFRGWNSSRY